jgi:hypothetical protein
LISHCNDAFPEIQDSLYWTCEFNRIASLWPWGANPSVAWCVQEIPVIGQAVTSVQDNMWRIVWSVSPEGTETG